MLVVLIGAIYWPGYYFRGVLFSWFYKLFYCYAELLMETNSDLLRDLDLFDDVGWWLRVWVELEDAAWRIPTYYYSISEDVYGHLFLLILFISAFLPLSFNAVVDPLMPKERFRFYFNIIASWFTFASIALAYYEFGFSISLWTAVPLTLKFAIVCFFIPFIFLAMGAIMFFTPFCPRP